MSRDTVHDLVTEIMDALRNEGWHIGDGCNDCSGWDDEAMNAFRKELRDLLESKVSRLEGALRKMIQFSRLLTPCHVDRVPGCVVCEAKAALEEKDNQATGK